MQRYVAMLAVLSALACAGGGDGRRGAGDSVAAAGSGAARSPGAAGDSVGMMPVKGSRVWYEVAGSGPVVVLVHGGNLDARMWDPQFAWLSATHRVVRYDLRGYGRSGNADSAFAAHDDLYELLKGLNIPRASIVGLSLGGRVAIDFALAHPEMVDRLVVAGPGLSGWTPDQRTAPDTMWLKEARAAGARGDTAAIGLAWLKSDFMRPAMEQSGLQAQLRTMATGNARLWSIFLRGANAEVAASPGAYRQLDKIKAPTLLIVGSRDVPEIHRIVDSLSVKVSGARKVVIDDAGHMVNMERPAQFNEALLAFLTR